MTTKDTPRKYVCIVGCGDIGTRLARQWLHDAAAVTGVVRSPASARRLEQAGIHASVDDLAEPHASLPALVPETLLYYFVPPPASGRHDTHCQHFLAQLDQQASKPQRIIAISTTGVYGNRQGGRVSEDDEPNPQVDRAHRRYDMENQLRHWCEQNRVDLILLRVGGIYGPGRLPLQRIKSLVPVLHEHLAPKTNRIHADDLVMICKKAADAPFNYRVYNVSDGQDSNMTEYFYTLADFFGLPRPPAVDWDTAEQTMSTGMLSYLRESRQLDNSRMLKELDIKLQYPDLLSGLETCREEK